MKTVNEKWDYRIDGKPNGLIRIAVTAIPCALFAVLTVDQLCNYRNGSAYIALAFAVICATLLFTLIRILTRYFCFKVLIGREGFYFQSNPFNGIYCKYSEVRGCSEQLISRRSSSTREMYRRYFFNIALTNGKSINFQFEKAVHEKEIDVLKKRIAEYN